jgi:hypothetical protein
MLSVSLLSDFFGRIKHRESHRTNTTTRKARKEARGGFRTLWGIERWGMHLLVGTTVITPRQNMAVRARGTTFIISQHMIVTLEGTIVTTFIMPKNVTAMLMGTTVIMPQNVIVVPEEKTPIMPPKNAPVTIIIPQNVTVMPEEKTPIMPPKNAVVTFIIPQNVTVTPQNERTEKREPRMNIKVEGRAVITARGTEKEKTTSTTKRVSWRHFWKRTKAARTESSTKNTK